MKIHIYKEGKIVQTIDTVKTTVVFEVEDVSEFKTHAENLLSMPERNDLKKRMYGICDDSTGDDLSHAFDIVREM
jgi:hypothetical protein